MNQENPLWQGVCQVKSLSPLKGIITVPGDKSISHRAVMLASLAKGKSSIHGFLKSEDCIATLKSFQQMGVSYKEVEGRLEILGNGPQGLHEPEDVINMGNSGTGTRLLLGILAGQAFSTTLTGDSSLRSRPMKRVTEPLEQMGARFLGRENGTKLPLTVKGGKLSGIQYNSPVASAQVKSALLLAGLFADGTTTVYEPGPSRDHTERMLETFGVDLTRKEKHSSLSGGQVLQSQAIHVPGDISSAAFFIVAACIVPDSELTIENVGINPTRTGLLDVLHDMGADIRLENKRQMGAEPVADLHVCYSPLKGVRISGDTVVRMIDEFPIFAVAASFASSPSIVEGAEELRVKESDRISTIVHELNRMGAQLEERPDGFEVKSGKQLAGTDVFSHGDHRIAMSLIIAGLAAKNETTIKGTKSIATSFPGFFDILNQISQNSVWEDTP